MPARLGKTDGEACSEAAEDACPLAGARWSGMVRAVDAVRDRRGRRVDPGIRDMVALLNLLDLPTLQSCEGHVNARGHGLAAPWVDLVVDGEVLARLAALLDAFHARGAPIGPWKAGEPRQSRLVFIGRNLNRPELRRGFEACAAG